jgi:hypothetical protein
MEVKILQPVQQDYTDFMNLPAGVYKNVQYYNSMQGRTFAESSLCRKEGCTYYSYTNFKVKKSKNGFYRLNTQKYGFTLDQKGKLSIWFGKNIFEIPGIADIFNEMNLNWLNRNLMSYVTKSIAEKMLTGKITNNIDLVKAYIKSMRLTCSPKVLYDYLSRAVPSKPYLLSILSVAKDQNHAIEYLTNVTDGDTHSYVINDMIKQAQILDRKIDFKWSSNRIKEEHQLWTKEIMDVEVSSMQDETSENSVNYLGFKHPGFTLLTTKKEVYAEGKTMNHCIYTNYWQTVRNGNYLVYHIDWQGESATLGLYITADAITLNQCYRYANRSISSALREQVAVFLDAINLWAKEQNLLKEELFIHF